jgi:VWFA-related protein
MSRFRAVSLLLFVSLSALAQQPRFGEKIEVKLVTIDVIVTGRGGERIYGLTARDFEAFESGDRQQITNFAEYRSAPGVGVTPEPSVAGAKPSSAAVESPPAAPKPTAATLALSSDREPGTVLVLVDWLPRDGFVRSRIFENLGITVSKVMNDGSKVGVVFWAPGFERAETVIEPSSDEDAVMRAIRKLAGTDSTALPETAASAQTDLEINAFDKASGSAATGGIDYQAQREASEYSEVEIQLFQLRRKTYAMQRLIRALAARPGRKSVLYVSTSFALPQGNNTQRLSGIRLVGDLARTANAGGVTFYAVRPAMPDPPNGTIAVFRRFEDVTRSVQGGSGFSSGPESRFGAGVEALSLLTLSTGGVLDVGLKSLETVGANLVADLQSYYSIGYRARDDGRDRQRHIVIMPKNRAYRVRARESIVEKSNETRAQDVLLTRLFGDEGGNDIHFEVVEAEARRTGPDRWLLPIIVKIPVDQLRFAPDGGEQVAHVKVLFVAARGVTDLTRITEATLKLIAGKDDGAGFVTYSTEILGDRKGSRLSIGVFDLRSGLAGARTIDNRDRFH